MGTMCLASDVNRNTMSYEINFWDIFTQKNFLGHDLPMFSLSYFCTSLFLIAKSVVFVGNNLMSVLLLFSVSMVHTQPYFQLVYYSVCIFFLVTFAFVCACVQIMDLSFLSLFPPHFVPFPRLPPSSFYCTNVVKWKTGSLVTLIHSRWHMGYKLNRILITI